MRTLTITLANDATAVYDDSDGPLTYDAGLVWVVVNHAAGRDLWSAKRVSSIEYTHGEDGD